MKSFMFLVFAFLAVAFYEMSGGADFEPRGLRVASPGPEAQPAESADESRLREARAETRPETVPAVRRAVRAEPIPVRDLRVENPQGVVRVSYKNGGFVLSPENRAAQVTSNARDISLVSLEQSPGLLGQPVAALGAPTVAEPRDVRAVAGSRVNLRSGPGTGYGVLETLAGGTEVEVLDSARGWLRLRPLDGGPVGWMAASLVTGAG